jgi:ATP-dependent RNA helicase DeaD
MTNGTTPTENGVADAAAMIAAITTETATASETTEPKAPSFDDLGLHPDVKLALDDMGYFAPTPVQTAVFKPVSEGKDLLVQSRTGTGKTTAFGLPIVNRMVPAARQPQALILAPTRELALQVARELTQIGKHRGIVIEAVYGGAPIGKQIKALRDGVHVVVGTPGRVLDHIGRRTLDLKTVSTFVLDECDEMLSMGFLEDIEKITSYLPEKHQTLLFSATMPDEVTRYARRHMPQRELISLSRDQISVSEIHHAYYIVSGIARSRDLLKIIFAEEPESAIIFCNTRDETTLVAKFLQKQGLDAEPLSSDLSQSDRERVMARMKAKNLRFLCATDVAARGIDISDLSHVINYSVPESPEVYVHRTGRTGRAGKKGTALSLVGPRELGNFRYVRLQFGIKPEERVLPKDDIFIGKLKVPLPPVGAPQPPDPVQILIRGVTGTANELETKIFEKLLGSMNGKRVLAALVAEKLNALSTKTSPRPRRERAEGAEGGDGERRFDREDRPRRFDRDGDRREGREDRPRRFDRDGERPRFGGEDRGEGGERREGRERPRFGEDRPREDRGEGREDRGERRFDRDRERPRFGGEDRGERRFDRDRGERRFDRDRDRGDRRDRLGREERHAREEQIGGATAEAAPTAILAEASAPVAAPVEAREERHARTEAPVAEAAADVSETADTQTTKLDEVARAATERHAEKPADKAKKRDKRSAPTEENKEFWETWAETKSTHAEPAREETKAAEAPSEEREERSSRRGRDKDRGRGREERASKKDDDRHAKKDERHAKEDRHGRAKSDDKKDSKREAAPAADGSQARLFVSLGKKHGVSADDLRTLLAGPIGGDTARIGSVSLRDSHAHVRVPEDLVDQIIAGVHGTLHNDHNVTVERARA